MDSGTAHAELLMPRLSDSAEEATILSWLKLPGETVVRGEPLVEVETDKSSVVYDAEVDGVLLEVLVDAGQAVRPGTPIARLGPSGSPPAAGRRTPRRRSPVTPVARRTARELDVSLDGLRGTGPGGRITREDVVAASSPRPPGSELSSIQRTIARRMAQSRAEIPDFTLNAEIDMTRALELRADLNRLAEGAAGVSVNDFVVRAAAIALREHPRLNSSFADDHVVTRDEVDIGVAVAAADILLVPVIRNADRLSLADIARRSRELAERARNRSLTPDDTTGGTFTVSNLGMFGVASFHAVINPPQAAILAIGAVVRRPVLDDSGAIVPRNVMIVSLSCDHRVVYGLDAAMFLQRLRELLEHPVALVISATRGAT